MYLYIVIITDPEGYTNIEVCLSQIQAENTVLEYQRWPGYRDYSYEIKEIYVENLMEIR
jgi:hypothetical protein